MADFLKRLGAIPDSVFFLSFAIVAGFVDVWLLIGWHNIDPRNLDWLDGDPAQYNLGWEFLRHESKWTFPLTWVDRLGYPLGVAAAYLDVIPLVALPLRLVSFLLPADFQYLGLYAVACYILQAYYGFRLTSCFAPGDRIVALIGGIFFLISPALTWRLFGHFATSTQWVIVAGLYYYFRPIEPFTVRKFMTPFVVLGFIAGAINPYIALFAVMLGACAVFRMYLLNRVSIIDCGVAGAALAGCTLISLAAVGFIFGGSGTQFGSSDAYTVFSMNLLAPFDRGKWPQFSGQYEGYNYLGIGVGILLLAALIRRFSLVKNLWGRPLLPLLLLSILCTLLALSVKVTVARIVLFTVPVPPFVFNALSSFRSSGRLFWPTHYMLILAAIAGAIHVFPQRWAMRLVLGLALIIQIVDVMPLRNAVAAQAQHRFTDPLVDPDWATISQTHRHLVVLPAWQCGWDKTPGSNFGQSTWTRFAHLADIGGMTINSFDTARLSGEAANLYCKEMPESLVRNGPEADTAYVLSDILAATVTDRPDITHYCRRVDGLNLCTFDPARSDQSRLLGQQILPPYSLGTEFRAEESPPNSVLLENFDTAPGPGRWTIGYRASFYMRPELPETGDLRLEMEFANVLLTDQHKLQRAKITVDGQPAGTWEFTLGGSNTNRSLIIPRDRIRPGEVTAITLELPDAAAPKDLGTNADDGRCLALNIRRMRIVAANSP